MIRIICSRCGGANVQLAMWVDPNSGDIHDEMHASHADAARNDESWCAVCDEHTVLLDVACDEVFAHRKGGDLAGMAEPRQYTHASRRGPGCTDHPDDDGDGACSTWAYRPAPGAGAAPWPRELWEARCCLCGGDTPGETFLGPLRVNATNAEVAAAHREHRALCALVARNDGEPPQPEPKETMP